MSNGLAHGLTGRISGFGCLIPGLDRKEVGDLYAFFKFDDMQLKEVHVRWAGIPLLAIIMAVFFGPDPGETWTEKYLMSLLYTGLYWNGACYLFFFYRKRFPLIKDTPKRLTFTTISMVSLFLVGDFIICSFIEGSLTNWQEYTLAHSFPSLIAGTVIGLIYEAVYFFEQWKRTIKVNEALKHQQLRTQFEVLQNQMSPHFLFNSLNTLTALIPEDADIAVEFTQKLSEVYRYILHNKERELVPVSEEMEFARAYVFLLKMRYPENLRVDFQIPDHHMGQYIAPLTLQMLIENAIKHNVVSKMHPLFIEVYVDNGRSIVVKNNLQKKNVIEKSTKTGLANIQKRYELLGNKVIDIMTTAKNFMVAVPLIDVMQQREFEMLGEQ